LVRERVSAFLDETRTRHAIAGYIAHLVQQAKIEGIVLSPDKAEDQRSMS
jgi:ribosomal protein S17E